MKKAVIIFLFFLCAIVTFAQSEAETVKPTFGVELDREVAAARIENEDYQNWWLMETQSKDKVGKSQSPCASVEAFGTGMEVCGVIQKRTVQEMNVPKPENDNNDYIRSHIIIGRPEHAGQKEYRGVKL